MEATLSDIRHRVSVNSFEEGATLSDGEIATLVEYASQAPSSFNFQNWRFIAVRDRDAKARLEAIAYGQKKVSQAAVTFIVLGLLNLNFDYRLLWHPPSRQESLIRPLSTPGLEWPTACMAQTRNCNATRPFGPPPWPR